MTRGSLRPSRRFSWHNTSALLCTSTDAGRGSCTVLVQDVIMHVVPLPMKGQHDYPPVEHVTVVAGDAARVLRTNP